MTTNTTKSLATAHPSLLRGLLTYFGGRAGSVENRQANRRAAIHEMNIEEAREHLDLYFSAFQMLLRVERSITDSGKNGRQSRALEEILSLLDAAGKIGFKIDALEDPVMAQLNESLRRLASQVRDQIADLNSVLKNKEQVNGNAISGKTVPGYQTALAYVGQMQTRLDSLTRLL